MSRVNQLAAALLLMGFARNYGWLLAEPASIGVLSKGLGAVAAMGLLYVISRRPMSRMLLIVLLWYGFEELQTAVCSFMYLADPWPVEPGQSMCSARIGFDIGAVGAFVVGLIAYKFVQDGQEDD